MRAKQDDLVYIEVNFTPKTKRNDPQPKLLDDGLDGAAVSSNSNKTWKGQAGNIAAAQKAFFHRAHMNGLAAQGKWRAELERQAA